MIFGEVQVSTTEIHPSLFLTLRIHFKKNKKSNSVHLMDILRYREKMSLKNQKEFMTGD